MFPVQAALALGFTLKELSEVFAYKRRGKSPCRHVHALARHKLERLEARILELERLRDALATTLEAWTEQLATALPGATLGFLDGLADVELPARGVPTLPRKKVAR